ncbi:MAG TPA: helix-turn-helix domain-containing protein [Dehalococcoidales bacterium]|nr:helix-turn-helix domain-containing protein [Dehalococcoidales bacterium]
MDIKAIRVRLNLTQEQLAQRIGVSWATVARWERGAGKPSPLAQKAIENLLKETTEGGEK